MSGTNNIGSSDGIKQPVAYSTEPAQKSAPTEQVGAGFSKENTVAHEGKNPLKNFSAGGIQVNLPVPTRNVSDATPQIQAELDNAAGGMDKFSIGSIFDQDGDGTSAIDELIADISAGKIEDGDLSARISEEGLGGMDIEGLMVFEERASDVFTQMSAIKSAPPEVMSQIDSLAKDAERALAMGNIEDVAGILAKIQTQLRDTRIKFDQEALQTAKQARENTHTQRVEKLVKAIEKMDEQARSGVIGKVFGAIATALAMVVGTVLIATGVLSKVGIVLMVASMALMAAVTISQNTGGWMNKVFGEDKVAQMVAGIMWSVIAVALSLGASAATAGKGASDAATQSVTLASKLVTHAKMVGHLAKMGAAAATATSGAADVHAARVGYEGKMYKASATDDLAQMTKFQQFMEDMLEAIERAIKEVNEGLEVVSDIIRVTSESKLSVAQKV